MIYTGWAQNVAALPDGRVRVLLSPYEYDLATRVGDARAESARLHRRLETYGESTDNQLGEAIADREGARGEIAVAGWTGLPWTGQPVVDDPYAHRRMPDVGDDVQVYWTFRIGLIVHPDDPDEQRWVLTIGRERVKILVGWRYAYEVKRMAVKGSDPRGKGHLLRAEIASNFRSMRTWGETQ